GTADRIPHRSRFQHDDVRTRFGEYLGRHAAAVTRADDGDVVDLAVPDDLHCVTPRLPPILVCSGGRRSAACARADYEMPCACYALADSRSRVAHAERLSAGLHFPR